MIVFESDKAAPMLMFDENAQWVLQAIGASGKTPGAFKKEEISHAISKLKFALYELKQQEKEQLNLQKQNINHKEQYKDDDKNEYPEDNLGETDATEIVLMSIRASVFLGLLEEINKKEGYLMWNYA